MAKNTEKLVPHSIMLARNEVEDIVGIVKESLHFAEQVWVIIDPDSTDGTEQKIRDTFPDLARINICKQVKSLKEIRRLSALYNLYPKVNFESLQDDGDEDHVQAGEGRLFMHWNVTYWVNKVVGPGEWWHWVAPDERFAPKDYKEIWYWVRYAQKFGYEAVYTNDHLFIRDESNGNKYDWCIWFTHPGTPHHFIRMPEDGWVKGIAAHSGCTLPTRQKRLFMPVSHYHFAYVKDTRTPFVGPRDHPEYQYNDRYVFYNPMGDDWKELTKFVTTDGVLKKGIPSAPPVFPDMKYKDTQVTRETVNKIKREIFEKKAELEKHLYCAEKRPGEIAELEKQLEELTSELR